MQNFLTCISNSPYTRGTNFSVILISLQIDRFRVRGIPPFPFKTALVLKMKLPGYIMFLMFAILKFMSILIISLKYCKCLNL